MTLVLGAVPGPGVGAGPGVLHWSAWEPSAAVGAGIGDQLLHWGCAAAALQARPEEPAIAGTASTLVS